LLNRIIYCIFTIIRFRPRHLKPLQTLFVHMPQILYNGIKSPESEPSFWFKLRDITTARCPSLNSSTWQGWLILLGFVMFEVWDFLRIDFFLHSVSDILRPFMIRTIGAIFLLIYICYKTGEKSRWRWGR
ncbi:MAG: hypothetical protein AAB972_00105, partial [Patescibacteria group bacterium]